MSDPNGVTADHTISTSTNGQDARDTQNTSSTAGNTSQTGGSTAHKITGDTTGSSTTGDPKIAMGSSVALREPLLEDL